MTQKKHIVTALGLSLTLALAAIGCCGNSPTKGSSAVAMKYVKALEKRDAKAIAALTVGRDRTFTRVQGGAERTSREWLIEEISTMELPAIIKKSNENGGIVGTIENMTDGGRYAFVDFAFKNGRSTLSTNGGLYLVKVSGKWKVYID